MHRPARLSGFCLVVASAALAGCSAGDPSVTAAAPTTTVTVTAAQRAAVTGEAAGAGPASDVESPREKASRDTARPSREAEPSRTSKRVDRSSDGVAQPVAPAAADATPTATAGLGACPGARMAKAGAASGKAPVQFSKGWTSGPVEGCTYTDKQGRTYKVTAAQNRMLYRVNQMRTLQTRKDGKKRPVLKPDFCLQELAQDYTNTRPGGHNPFLMKMYAVPGGGGAATGSVWIGENLGAHYGYTDKRMAMVDRLVYNWFTSGSLSSGHYGNMMDKDWRRAGFGILINGSSVVSIQNFSADPAYYAYPGGKKCSKPPKKKYGSSTVPPIGPYPDPPGQ